MKLFALLFLVVIALLGVSSEEQEKITKSPKVICVEPAETGRCLAYFLSFRYNPETKVCEDFVYGGCGGNSNRFGTKEECEEFCKGV